MEAPRQRLGRGTIHTVYAFRSDDTKAFKTADGQEINSRDIEIFKSNPEIFPIVYRVGKTYVVLERLNTQRASREYETLTNVYGESIVMAIYHAYMDDDFRELHDRFYNTHKQYRGLYSIWEDLVLEFLHSFPKYYRFDLHGGQFGYSDDGRLKVLDF